MQPPARAQTREKPGSFPPGYLAERLGLMERASLLMGLPVYDRDEHKLGKVEDFYVELGAGRIVCALVAPKGGDHYIAVPATSFAAADRTKVMLGIARAKLEEAPALRTALADPSELKKFVDDSCGYFDGKVAGKRENSGREMVRCSELIGLTVRNEAQENLGKVVNLMLDIPIGRIVFAVVSLDGTGGGLYAVPPGALMRGKGILLLKAERAKLKSMAQPDSFFWTEITKPAYAAGLYRMHGQEPDFDASGAVVPGATQGVMAVKAGGTAAAGGRVGPTDAELSRSILTAMVRADSSYAFLFKKIKICVANGVVTLSGQVKDQESKEKLGAIAESVAGTGQVNNQLVARK
ncbi:MAG: antigen [Pedosphaera sp.]|nr:antigen [Pedosphaera sp.]